MQWYAAQRASVKLGSVVSDNFLITNGVRQGEILSLLFFVDLVIISPSVKGLQRLLDICDVYGQNQDILFHHDKTVCMYMPSGNCYYLNTPVVVLNGI